MYPLIRIFNPWFRDDMFSTNKYLDIFVIPSWLLHKYISFSDKNIIACGYP